MFENIDKTKLCSKCKWSVSVKQNQIICMHTAIDVFCMLKAEDGSGISNQCPYKLELLMLLNNTKTSASTALN